MEPRCYDRATGGENGRVACIVLRTPDLSRPGRRGSACVRHLDRGRALGDCDDVCLYLGEPLRSDAARLGRDGAPVISKSRGDRRNHRSFGGCGSGRVIVPVHALVGRMGLDCVATGDVSRKCECCAPRNQIARKGRDAVVGATSDAGIVDRMDLVGGSENRSIAELLANARANYERPLTQTSCLSECTISTRSFCASITASMSLYAPGVSSSTSAPL